MITLVGDWKLWAVQSPTGHGGSFRAPATCERYMAYAGKQIAMKPAMEIGFGRTADDARADLARKLAA